MILRHVSNSVVPENVFPIEREQKGWLDTMQHELVVVLDFGGQYNQLIARRVRECNVYCEVKPYTTPLEELKALNPIGIIFTGGPNSCLLYTSDAADE